MTFDGRKLRSGTGCVVALLLLAWSAQAQQGTSSRILGTVTAVSGDTVAVKTDAGGTVSVTVPESARILRTVPGQKTLAGAMKIAVSEIGSGDRVLVIATGTPPVASIVVVNKAGDVAARQEQERADWQRRGVGGLVKAVDAAQGTVTIASGPRTVTIHTTPATVIRRYAADSIRFSDAKPSTLGAIAPGDQLMARGNRNGDEVTAEEIVAGTFRNIAGVVESVDAANGTFAVRDLATKKMVKIRTAPDSDLRRLDVKVADEIAARLKAASGDHEGEKAGRTAERGEGGAAAAPQEGEQRDGNAFAQVLRQAPVIRVGDLHKGDAVMIVATSGDAGEATALRLVAGVEPMLRASAHGSQSLFSSAWSLGGGSSGGGNSGEGNP